MDTDSGGQEETEVTQRCDFARLGVGFSLSTSIGDAGLEHLKALAELEDLDLDATLITDAGLKHLQVLRQLRRLQVAYSAVTDAGLQHLETLSNLEGLNTRRTKVTPEA